MEKFCYLSDIICCYGGASETLSVSTSSACKKFKELSGELARKQSSSLEQ